MRVELGILIGNKIQIFIDGKFLNKNDIILIDEIEFTRENEKGLNFVKLFSKSNYNKQIIENYAQEKIENFKETENFESLKDHMLSESYRVKIIDLLKTELLNNYQEKIIDKVFNTLDIKVENKHKSLPIENYTTIRTKKNINTENFNELNRKLPIGKYVKKTFNELITNNLIDRNEIERLQRGDYSKLTFDIQFPFLAKETSPFFEKIRYWKDRIQINGEIYFVCSQWYEVPANNDRPYYEEWLKKMKKL